MTRSRAIALGAVVVAALLGAALLRGGLLDLPAAPGQVTAKSAGLEALSSLRDRADRLERANGSEPDSALALAAGGLAALRSGDLERGLVAMRTSLRMAPRDLVIGNAFRMAVFHLRRRALTDAVARATLAGQLPVEIVDEPIATLAALDREQPSREARLQLALAWVDQLMLFPALEIKAPASVSSVELLDSLLASDPTYVPGLYARGLNFLHRPARLVWPEARKAAPDAASRDLGLCVAIGRKIGGAPAGLVATLALALGDAYAKEGHAERARSWWQIAQNQSRDPALLEAIRRRFGWGDAEMLDRLEAELEDRMLDLDHPLTDLSMMWGEEGA